MPDLPLAPGGLAVAGLDRLIALCWSATHVPHVAKFGQLGHMFDHWKMENEDVVYGRELFGLLIVASWMLVLTLASRRRRPARSS